ncbi:MAG: 5'/3'-nucleotidase SurE [Lachnospiraceae bacterium]|nr:5'/3'-nucleotidase SurE [Lachnospiraceae bacterium]
MDRKILIVNDDGIDSDGLIRLTRAALPFGEVWVVAPESQRSASSHSITLRDHLDIYPRPQFPVEGVKAFSCSGTPADCVRAGVRGIMPYKPDVVISGINYGYNVATDIQYSGTDGAAFEGAFQGFHALAFSEEGVSCHEVTDRYLSDLLAELIDKPLDTDNIWNVNFPGCPLSECKGVLFDRTVSHSLFFDDEYIRHEDLDNGGFRLKLNGIHNRSCEEGSDMHAVINGYVSVGVVSNTGF